MKPEQQEPFGEKLDALWARYCEAHEEIAHNAHFMPQLWERIEARRKRFLAFEQIARVFVSAAVALSLVFGGVLAVQNFEQARRLRSETYIDVLAAEHASADSPDIAPFHSTIR